MPRTPESPSAVDSSPEVGLGGLSVSRKHNLPSPQRGACSPLGLLVCHRVYFNMEQQSVIYGNGSPFSHWCMCSFMPDHTCACVIPQYKQCSSGRVLYGFWEIASLRAHLLLSLVYMQRQKDRHTYIRVLMCRCRCVGVLIQTHAHR